MSSVNKKEPINGFPCILKFGVDIGTIYKLTLISSFIIWVRGYHQKTHFEVGTYLYLSQSSRLIILRHDWKHVSCVSNKINEQSAFKIWTHQTELHFTLFHWFKRRTWWRTSLGGDTGKQYSSNMADDFVRWSIVKWVEKSGRFQSWIKYSNGFLLRHKQREEKFVLFFQKHWPFIRESCDEKRVVEMFGKLSGTRSPTLNWSSFQYRAHFW